MKLYSKVATALVAAALKVTTACLAITLAGCASKMAIEPVELKPLDNVQVEIERLWAKSAGSSFDEYYIKVHPAVSENLVFAVGGSGELRAFNQSSGEKQWSLSIDDEITGAVAAGYGNVVIISSEGMVANYASKSGDELWQTQLELTSLAPALITDSLVVIQSVNDQVVALDRKTGKETWRFKETLPLVSLWGNSQPQIYQNWIIAALGNGRLVALNKTDGQLEWERKIGIAKGQGDIEQIVDVDGQFIISGDDLFIASYQENVVAMNLIDGSLGWYRPISSYNDLAVDESALYVIGETSKILALGRYDGQIFWQNDELYGRKLTGISILDNYLLVVDYEGYMHLVDKYSGAIVGRKRIGKELMAGPFLVNQSLAYTINRDGILKAYQINTEQP